MRRPASATVPLAPLTGLTVTKLENELLPAAASIPSPPADVLISPGCTVQGVAAGGVTWLRCASDRGAGAAVGK